MSILLYLLLILLSFGQLERIVLLGGLVNGYVHELIMAAFVIGALLPFLQKKISVKVFRLYKSEIVFLGALFVSYLASSSNFTFWQNAVAFLYFFRIVLIISFFLCLWHWLSSNKNRLRHLGAAILLFVSLTTVFSVAQYVLYPNLRNLYYLGWDPHWYRVFGTFFDTSITSSVFLISFFWLACQKKTIFVKVLLFCMLVLMLFTYSRALYISLFGGLLYIALINRKLHYVIAAFFLFLGVVAILPRPAGESVRLERMFSIHSRISDVKDGLQTFKHAPVFGIGYNRIGFVRSQKELTSIPDHSRFSYSSTYITLLASSGIVGLAGFLFFVGNLFARGRGVVRAIIVTLMIYAFFDNIFLHTFVLTLLLIIVAEERTTRQVHTLP